MIQLCILGALDLRGPDGNELRSVLVQPKRLALLIYLVLEAPRGFVRRDRLLALFWPELDSAHARNSLSQALRVLRRGLGDGVLVNRGDEEVGVEPGSLECDARAFEAALAASRPAEALGLYRGDLLVGFDPGDVAPEYEQWLEDERGRLRERALEAALGLVSDAERQGNLPLALQWARRAAGLAPYDEGALGARLRLMDRLGDRAGALVAFQDFARRLDAELGLEPSAELRAIVDGIRSRAVDAPREAASTRAAAAATGASALSDRPPGSPAGTPAARAGGARGWLGTGRLAGGRRASLIVIPLALLAVVVTASGLGRRLLRPESSTRDVAETSVAVLPFTSLSEAKEDAYLASGLQEELRTQLGKLGQLRVINHTSVQPYAGSRQPRREIAEALGVTTLVEASVQRAGDRIRVSVQLVDARTGRDLWAEHYDRDLGDLFAMQTEIARAIVAALHAELTAGERSVLARAPTRDRRAYEFYLQAGEYARRPTATEPELQAAQRLYERAVALDPGFALAHARLAMLHATIYVYGWDRTPARQEASRREAETALRLQPELPEAHAALAWSLFPSGASDTERIRRELEIAAEGLPNDAYVQHALAGMRCRQNRWDECIAGLRRATRLDPRNAAHASSLGGYYWQLRRYPEAVAAFDRAVELAPDFHYADLDRGKLFVAWRGTTDSLAAALRRLPPDWDERGFATYCLVQLAEWERRPADALAALAATRHQGWDQWSFELPFSLLRASAHEAVGDMRRARAGYEEARASLEPMVAERPESAMRHAMLGLAYAGLGRKEAAVREARRATELVPLSRDANEGAMVRQYAAQILAQVGEVDAALRELELILSIPSYTSVEYLRREWRWDPLRRDPRFQLLLEGKRLDGTPMPAYQVPVASHQPERSPPGRGSADGPAAVRGQPTAR